MTRLPKRDSAGLVARRVVALFALSVLGALACDMPAPQNNCTGPLRANTGTTDPTCMIGNRSFILHVPPSYTGQTAVPLVIDMHGFTSSGSAQRGNSGWLAKSNASGFVIAWPNGV